MSQIYPPRRLDLAQQLGALDGVATLRMAEGMESFEMRSRFARSGLGAVLTWVAAVGCGGTDGVREPGVDAPASTVSGSPAVSEAAGGIGPAPTAGSAGSLGAAAPTGAGQVSANKAGSPAAGAGAAGVTAAGAGDGAAAVGGGGATAAAAGSTATAGSAANGGVAASTGPTLPPVDDPAGPGPFTSRQVPTADGLSSHALFVPSETGSNGKNPVVVWTCGNGGTVSFYQGFLEHLASHGFFVVADKGSSSDRMAEVQSQNDAIAWVLQQNMSGEYSGKLDVDHIAVMGHSLGSLASFATAAMNEHVAASVHYSGGLTGNPVGFDMSWQASMRKPAAFLCGGNDTSAGPACADDFDSAPAMLPVFYGTLNGADHIGPFGTAPRGGEYGKAGVAWLRWKLANDDAYKSWFVGSDCKLCGGLWTGMARNLE
jgi:dienelactone hydrolase